MSRLHDMGGRFGDGSIPIPRDGKNEITNINNKLKFSEDTLIIFVSPHIPVETAYEMPEAVAMARIDLCE